MLHIVKNEQGTAINELGQWAKELIDHNTNLYTSNLYSASQYSAMNVAEVPAQYSSNSPLKNGFEILNTCFDHHLTQNPSLFAFGEDVGHIGDVNQGFAGLQAKHGVERVFDTGIRE